MKSIDININKIKDFIDENQLYRAEYKSAFEILLKKTGKGNDFLGWMDLPKKTDDDLLQRINTTANKLRKQSDIIVVVGIGGSYLGARAVINALSGYFHTIHDKKRPLVIYAGNQICEDYHTELLSLLDNHDYSLIIISKSGTTTEPALAFRLLKNHIENKYGKTSASDRIVTITDEQKGALRKMTDNEGYVSFIIPDDVGGRYSVLTPVGLLPIAAAGFDIKELIKGAASAMENTLHNDLNKNLAYRYAASRNELYKLGKNSELMVSYQPKLHYFQEWWKQLFGESEGKEHKGIFPASADFTTDLHSLGQYIQDGRRAIFETVLSIEQPQNTLKVPVDKENLDGLNYLSGKRLSYINAMAEQGTTLAHHEGGVPVIQISIPEINEYLLGQLIYFFEFACGLSAYMLDVNPFDQPGVEAYKMNMFALLGKPGFEKEKERLLKKLI